MSGCRLAETWGSGEMKYVGRGRKTWGECMKNDMKFLGLQPKWAMIRDMWRDLIWSKRLILAQRGRMGRFQNK